MATLTDASTQFQTFGNQRDQENVELWGLAMFSFLRKNSKFKQVTRQSNSGKIKQSLTSCININLSDVAGLAPGHFNKVNTTIK